MTHMLDRAFSAAWEIAIDPETPGPNMSVLSKEEAYGAMGCTRMMARAALLAALDPEDEATLARVKTWLCENRHLHLLKDDVRNVIAGLRACIAQGET